jgi:hypothetical protein
MNEGEIIRRAYAEASLVVKERGLTGMRAVTAVIGTTAKVATRILGREITVDDVERVIHS